MILTAMLYTQSEFLKYCFCNEVNTLNGWLMVEVIVL